MLECACQVISVPFYTIIDISSTTIVKLSKLEGWITSLESLNYVARFITVITICPKLT